MCHVVGPLTLDAGCFQTIRHNLTIRALNTDNAITSRGIWYDVVIIWIQQLRGDSPSFEAVTDVVSRAFRDGALSCAISERASPSAVSFRRHLPVKLSHWHRPTDSVGRLLVCPPRRTGPYAACLRGSSQMNARQRFTDRLPAFGKCLGRKSLTFFRKPKSAEM